MAFEFPGFLPHRYMNNNKCLVAKEGKRNKKQGLIVGTYIKSGRVELHGVLVQIWVIMNTCCIDVHMPSFLYFKTCMSRAK